MNCFQVVKVSDVGCQEKAPLHQPRFFEENSTSANNSCELMVWLGTDSPRLYFLPGQFFLETGQKKTLELRAQLMRHKDANLHLTKKCALASKKQLSIICQSKLVHIFKARQGSADAPQGCKPALGQEARHWLPKSNQPDFTIYLLCIEKHRHIKGSLAPTMLHKDANLRTG